MDSVFGQIMSQVFGSFDMGIYSFFAALHCGVATIVANVFSAMGSSVFLILMFVFSLFLLLFKKTRRLGIYTALSIILVYVIAGLILNPMLGRLRPYNMLQSNSQYFSWYLEVGAVPESEYSFPSKHAASAFAIATCVFFYIKYEFKKNIGWVAFLWAFFVAASRLYLMVHYPTDVIAGILLGIIIGLVIVGLYKLIYYLLKKHTGCIENLNRYDLCKYLLQNKHICITKKFAVRFLFIVVLCFTAISFGFQMYGLYGGFHKCSYKGQDYICLNKADNKNEVTSDNNANYNESNNDDKIEYYCDIHDNK